MFCTYFYLSISQTLDAPLNCYTLKRVLQKKTADYKEFINASILASKYQGESFPKKLF